MFSIFADESGTDSAPRCYTIGGLVIPDNFISTFDGHFEKLKTKHGVMGEIKWKKIDKSHGAINFGIDLLRLILHFKLRIGFIVVKKQDYVKWNKNKESGFYTSYTQFLKHVLKASTFSHKIYIDNRTDSYNKQDEVIEIITNNMLNQLKVGSMISAVEKSDSKKYSGIQSIDLFTGAINFAHNLYLDKNFTFNKGKALFIKKIAEMLGWDTLHYDTWPSNDINIWHFPQEYRNTPKTQTVKLNTEVIYIKPEDLLN